MRNSKTKLGLSLANEAVAYKLALRVGSNSTTWVKHENLAIECGVTEWNLSSHIKKLAKTKIIIVEKQSHDKRKNCYRFSDLLTNYHQMSDKEKRKVHEALGDEMLKNKSNDDKNTPRKRGVIDENTPRKRGVITPRKRGVISTEENATAPANTGLDADDKIPKVKDESNNYNQNNRASAVSVNLQSYPQDFYPDEARRELLTQHARRVNLTELELLNKFESVHMRYKTRSKDWQETFEDFLKREQPKRVYEDSTGRNRRYDNKPIYN